MSIIRRNYFWLFTLFLFIASVQSAHAAILKISPSTGVYTAGTTFTASVLLNTEGKAVNAADAKLSFNPRELQVVSVSRGGSIFNMWTEEPAFSNGVGTVTFSGGALPPGYKGSAGTIVSITFKALGAGTPKVSFTSGSALAADGMGTNVLTSMNGATYTIAAQSDAPAPEYIPPANTPKAPEVVSQTHPDTTKWYREKTAKLSWELPDDVVAVRMLLDENEGTVPTKVYEEHITEKTIEDLPEGVSYFHVQFKNKDGWGRIAHFRLAVDTVAPQNFVITEEVSDSTNPTRTLLLNTEDVSPITEYKIQIDGKDPFVFKDDEFTKKYALEPLMPGYHTLTIEAFDSAGNTTVASYSLTIDAFEKPIFIDYPTRINTEVIPAIKGKTRPNAEVTVTIARASDGGVVSADSGEKRDPMTVTSNAEGEFTFITNAPFDQGVYVITAVARDSYGSVSEPSDEIKIIVEAPGYVVVGSLLINILSVLVPVTALIVVLIFGTWYLWHRLIRWKRRVLKEAIEAEERLTLEFDMIVQNLNESIAELKNSRKSKLTKAESALIERIESDVMTARTKIKKEIEDIEKVLK